MLDCWITRTNHSILAKTRLLTGNTNNKAITYLFYAHNVKAGVNEKP